MLVDFFFVLSGFVLTHAYFQRYGSFFDFVGRRLARHYPLHVFALLVFLGLQLVKVAAETWGGALRQEAFSNLNWWNFADTIFLLQSTGLLWHSLWAGSAPTMAAGDVQPPSRGAESLHDGGWLREGAYHRFYAPIVCHGSSGI